jgi:hypothetical protein
MDTVAVLTAETDSAAAGAALAEQINTALPLPLIWSLFPQPPLTTISFCFRLSGTERLKQ